MKNRIIFMNDILFHSTENKETWHTWISDIINPAIHLACNQNIVLFTDLKDNNENSFDRNKFYSLSNIYDIPLAYYSYDINIISQKSWNYLFSFIKKTDFIIGCELGLDLRNKLTDEGYLFINFWFHSFHLFDDICFMLNTNDKNIFNKIKKYQIPREKFDLYTTIIKKRLSFDANNLSIDDNCCLFIGQSMKDKSVEKDGKFLNISDFPNELEEASKKYKKIYYLHHPYCPIDETSPLFNFIKKRPYIEVLKGIPTYTLLASSKVKKVLGVSSSVLYEAQFFGKQIKYLYKPLFDIDKDFGDNTFLSVYNDYLNPEFWIEIFDGYFYINKSNRNISLFDKRKSVLRSEILNGYHGYRPLDQFSYLSDRIDSLVININKKIETQMKNMCKILEKILVLENRPKFTLKLFEKYNFNGISKFYILGIPVYKRKNTVFYFCEIPVYDKKINKYLFSKKQDNFYKYLRILGITFRTKNYQINSGERETGIKLEGY